MAKVVDCIMEESDIELLSRCYVNFQTKNFGKGIEPLYPQS